MNSENFIMIKKQYLPLLSKISYAELMLLCEIDSLSYNEKHNDACMASNNYFANLFCTTARNIQKYLKVLRDLGLIKQHEDREGMRTVCRKIYIQHEIIEKLLHEQMDTISSLKRTNGSDMTNKKVLDGEQMDATSRTNGHPNNKIKESIINNNKVIIDANASPLEKKDKYLIPNKNEFFILPKEDKIFFLKEYVSYIEDKQNKVSYALSIANKTDISELEDKEMKGLSVMLDNAYSFYGYRLTKYEAEQVKKEATELYKLLNKNDRTNMMTEIKNINNNSVKISEFNKEQLDRVREVMNKYREVKK